MTTTVVKMLRKQRFKIEYNRMIISLEIDHLKLVKMQSITYYRYNSQ